MEEKRHDQISRIIPQGAENAYDGSVGGAPDGEWGVFAVANGERRLGVDVAFHMIVTMPANGDTDE